MKQIQSIADIEELKVSGTLPYIYIYVIKEQLLEWFEAEGTSESLTTFRLSNQSCMYHLEDEDDASFLLD